MKNLSWNIDEPMMVSIKLDNKEVMKISIAEIIDSSSRQSILNHINICDNTPWLKHWHEQKNIKVE